MLRAGNAAGVTTAHLLADATESKPEEKLLDGGRDTIAYALRIVKHITQVSLSEIPGLLVDRFGAEKVGNHPLSAGAELGGEIGIAGCSKEIWSGRQHLGISHNHLRRIALEADLGAALVIDCGSGRGVAVHRSNGSDAYILAVIAERTVLGQVVDNAGAHSDKHTVLLLNNLVQQLDELPVRMEAVLGDDIGRSRDACLGQFVENPLASHLPGNLVGENYGLAAGVVLVEKSRNPVENVLSEFEGLGCNRDLECLGNHFLCIHINRFEFLHILVQQPRNSLHSPSCRIHISCFR